MAVPLFAPRRAPAASAPAEQAASTTKKKQDGSSTAHATAARPMHTYAREAAALVLLASALYSVLALASFEADPMRPEVTGPNWVGPVGEAFSSLFSGAFGIAAWTIPLELSVLAGPLLGGKPSRASVARLGGDIVVLVILAALAHVAFPMATAFGALPLGGSVGELFGEVMRSLFSAIGSYIIGLTIVSLILVQRATFSFIELVAQVRAFFAKLGERGAFGLGAILKALRRVREIEKAADATDAKDRTSVAKNLTPSPTDVVITVLTDDSAQHRKDKPFEGEASASGEADKPQRKKRAASSKQAATNETNADGVPSSPSSDHGDAIALGATTPVPSEAVKVADDAKPAAKIVRNDEAKPVVKIARAEEPKRVVKAAVADAAKPVVKVAAATVGLEAAPVDAAKPAAKAVVPEDKRGPAIVAPPANPDAIVAAADMNAPDELFDAAVVPPSDKPAVRGGGSPRATKSRKAEVAEPRAERVAKTVRAEMVEVSAEDGAKAKKVEASAALVEDAPVQEDVVERPRAVKKTVTPPPVRAVAPQPIVERTVHVDDDDDAEDGQDEPGGLFLNDEPMDESDSPEPVAVVAASAAEVSKPVTLEKAKVREVVKVVPSFGKGFTLPSTTMLEPPGDECIVVDEDTLRENAGLLEKTLADYGVSGKVEEIHPGPTVTTFEVAPAAGTKVSKVASLADDLALGLSRKVRIIAPIPGKNRIGFELPNDRRVPVSMRELVEDRRFLELKAPLPCVLGRDIVGAPYFADLASMPHVIVAGATGAGKSVGLNVMLVSLLFRKSPAELRMLMIDPKVVELAPFDRIPHMLLPVVTDMKQASNALKWAVDEMERRYQLFANAGTKNIGTYNAWVEKVERGEARPPKPPANAKVAAISAEGLEVEVPAAKDGSDVAMPEKLPYIVIVVDEFADLMMQQGKDVEASVARLAQKARAAGMHVILATQRPSVDVITGMIKANFPTRIAFRVAQKVDSRTILDEQGAEHLLGRGDMLVKMNGATDTRRVQCPFVSEEEVQRITDFLRAQGEPVYDEAILKPRDEDGKEEDNDTENDPMYDAAVRIVAETRRCSTSWIQRKLGVGYNRAAKMVEAMERRGIVGPANGAKDREVLIAPL
ncbi:MAG: DNA translocase FtsK 4TM domain-containing protein [Polyangiaceae bacterium]|nr:DNA translocase FtsK 4TM domain-containing protein [Polyangiaceae bacterium]